MKQIDADFSASLSAAPDVGIEPASFFWVQAKNRDTGAVRSMGLWSGDENITISVRSTTGGQVSRTYLGGCNLDVSSIKYVLDLTDQSVSVSMSQIAPATQQLVRGYDVRMAYCEIHQTTWTKGRLTGVPDLMWVGIVDEPDITTPEAGGEGAITLSIRSEAMTQLTAINPAKSSDSHQKKRSAGDTFSEYSGVIKSRNLQWYFRKQ